MTRSNRLKYRLILYFHYSIPPIDPYVAFKNAGPMTICALTKHQHQLMHVGPLTLD